MNLTVEILLVLLAKRNGKLTATKNRTIKMALRFILGVMQFHFTGSTTIRSASRKVRRSVNIN